MLFRVRRRWNEQKTMPYTAAAGAAAPGGCGSGSCTFCPAPHRSGAAVPEKLTTVVEQPVEVTSSEAEEETLPKLPYADGVYVGSSRGYGGAVRVQVTMENGSITEVEILDASHETKQFLRRAKRLLTTVVETQSWEVDAVSEATYTSRGILGAVQNALTGEVVSNPLPPQPKPAATLVVEEFTAPSIYLDGIYTAEAMGFEGQITVQVTVAEDKITDITILSAEDEEEYLSRAKQVIPAILEGQSPNVDAVSGATYSSTGILNAVKLALAKAAVAPAEEADPEQAASEEAAEEAVPSETAKPEETPVTAPTVEVVQPEGKSAVSAWFKEVWQQLFPAETPDDSEPEPATSAEVLPASEPVLPPEETETEPETEGAAE